jgi:hypothetical protein
MSDLSLRATGSARPSEHKEHVRCTIGATLLFLLAIAFAAVVSAPSGGGAPAPADGPPILVAGS